MGNLGQSLAGLDGSTERRYLPRSALVINVLAETETHGEEVFALSSSVQVPAAEWKSPKVFVDALEQGFCRGQSAGSESACVMRSR